MKSQSVAIKKSHQHEQKTVDVELFRILLVEDDDIDAQAVKRMLKPDLHWNCELTRANNLNTASQQLADTDIDVVLLDLGLPGSQGLQTISYVRKYSKSVPIIVLSGHEGDDLHQGAIDLGVQDYLLKGELGKNTLRRSIRYIVGHARVESILNTERQQAEFVLKSISDAVITFDDSQLITFMNPSAQQITGWTSVQALGRQAPEVFNVIDERTRQTVTIDHSLNMSNETLLIGRNKQEINIKATLSPLQAAGKGTIGSVLVFNDVSEKMRMEREISHQASHDSLTGLINRRTFEQRLHRIVKDSSDNNSEHALCYLDLDHFKIINDECGHLAGDELLRQLSSLLTTKIRKRDTFARLGGDEFGVLLEHCSLDEAHRMALVIHKAIKNFDFSWQSKNYGVGSSIGLVPINQQSIGEKEILNQADIACYAAKDAGRDQIYTLRVGDELLSLKHAEYQQADNISNALNEDRFELWAQPIVSLNDVKSSHHFEVLLRMKDMLGNIKLPDTFLPTAERNGICPSIDKWVIKSSLELMKNNDIHTSRYAINLSGQSIGDPSFLDFILNCFEETKLPPKEIVFEITETAAIANLSHAVHFIKELKAIGCQFSLDDFGTGLSSFAYLKQLPVDFLKIDAVFVRDILTDPISLAMVRSINDIGKVMGKLTIAEGVEDKLMLPILREIGVDFAQGYAIQRPQPLKI